MARFDYDLFTIGAGSGGVAASRRAGAHGARVGICEERRVGGTCVLRGCVPKKLLVYASSLRDAFADAPGYGWSFEGLALDWSRLIDAKDRELARLEGIYRTMLQGSGVELIEGRGRILDPHTVEIEGRRVTAARILVATGGWPTLPEIPGIEYAMTSNEALDRRDLPRHVAIVGAGYIGVEFAGIWHSAGSKVTQIIRGGLPLRGFDDDVRRAVFDEMTRRGVAWVTDNHVNAIERHEDGLRLRLDRGEHLDVDAVLYATGRHPHSRDLGLQDVGVTLNDTGAIVVDEWSRTSVPSIFAVGDVTHRVALTPVAIADGRAFAESEFNDNPTPVDHVSIPSAVFSQPPVGTVGLTEAQARDLGLGQIVCYRTQFRPMKYVLPERPERVLMKLVVDAQTDRVLGAHMVGADAPEIIQGFAVALRSGATKKDFDGTVGIHPTSAEEFVTMYTPVA